MRETENLIPKSIIAKRALPYIHEGQTLFMDASSTVCQLAEKLTGFQHLRVITNGLKTANILSEIEGVEVYGTGGRLRENAKSFVGPQAIEFVSRFTADLAFFSCRGVHPETGATDSSEDEASLKRMYMRNAKRVILLCDASKLGKENFCKIGSAGRGLENNHKRAASAGIRAGMKKGAGRGHWIAAARNRSLRACLLPVPSLVYARSRPAL